MKEEKLKKRLIYGIIIFQIFLTALAFLIQILRIYFGHKNEIPIFTRSLTGKYLLEIIAIIIITILAIIVVGVLSYKYNLDDKRTAKITYLAKLKALVNIIPLNKQDSLEYKELIKLRNKRYYAYGVATLISLVCVLFSFLYMFNTKHFISNGDAFKQSKKLFMYLSPWVIISFIAFIVAKFYEEYNAKKAIDIAKMIINPKECEKKVTKKSRGILIAQISILVVAVALIIFGSVTGGASDVFIKAAKICSECIGLG